MREPDFQVVLNLSFSGDLFLFISFIVILKVSCHSATQRSGHSSGAWSESFRAGVFLSIKTEEENKPKFSFNTVNTCKQVVASVLQRKNKNKKRKGTA